MKIERIESITYGVEDIDEGVRFFTDWGLKSSGDDTGAFKMPSGQTIHLRHLSDPLLASSPEKSSTVREVVWGVDTTQSLESIGKQLSEDREVKIDQEGTLHTHDDLGFGIGFCVSKGINGATIKPSVKRFNAPFDPPRMATPFRIGHVVYSIERKDQQNAANFYSKRLQFRITDHTVEMGDFLRANGSTDHHNVFFLLFPNRPAFHHVAFEVRDFDEILFGGKNMLKKGWRADSPPGRHNLGSNLFWYFSNPCGGSVEYFADMDQMDDDFQTRTWEKSPGFAMWTLESNDIPAPSR